MNVLKNFEALFVVTLGLACAANYALDNTSTAATPTPVVASAASTTAPNLQVVVVSAKRMSAEEKKQSLIDERNAMASNPAPSKI
jgi:hypothetical protein